MVETSMTIQRLSRRSLLKSIASASTIGTAPVLVSTRSNAADAFNLTLPWIPEGEVAFMYAARKEGFWTKRGLDVTITRGFGSREAAKNVGGARQRGQRPRLLTSFSRAKLMAFRSSRNAVVGMQTYQLDGHEQTAFLPGYGRMAR
jgi:hypothetical protein